MSRFSTEFRRSSGSRVSRGSLASAAENENEDDYRRVEAVRLTNDFNLDNTNTNDDMGADMIPITTMADAAQSTLSHETSASCRADAAAAAAEQRAAMVPTRHVEVRIEFISIGEVDTMNEKYQAEVKITARWYDDQQIEKYDKSQHWNPKLFVRNALHDVKEQITHRCQQSDNRTCVTETRIAKGSFWERIELQSFPIDRQDLSITLASRLTSNHVKLTVNTNKRSIIHSETLKTFRDQQKWRLYQILNITEWISSPDDNKMMTSNMSNLNVNEFHEIKITPTPACSKVIATCCCSSSSSTFFLSKGFFLVNCYAFIFLITVLSMTLFAYDTENARLRISGTFTLILTSISFKMVTGRFVPTISYMTSLDRYQMLSLIYLCCCCVWHSSISEFNMTVSAKRIADKVVLGVFATLFLSIQVYILFGIGIALRKIKQLKKSEQSFKAMIGPDTDVDDSDEDDDDQPQKENNKK